MTLDVGGTVMRVQRGVLTQVEGSVLAVRFSDLWVGSESVFIDFPIEIFKPMVDLLRVMWNLPEFSEPALSVEDFAGDKRLFRRFLGMVDFYGLLESFYLPKTQSGTYGVEGFYDSRACNFFDLEPKQTIDMSDLGSFKLKAPDKHIGIVSCQIDVVDADNPVIVNILIGYLISNGQLQHVRYLEKDLASRVDLHPAKRWVLTRKKDTPFLTLTITRLDDSHETMTTAVENVHLNQVIFEGRGGFCLSNVKFSC